jgi:hypothetical protein
MTVNIVLMKFINLVNLASSGVDCSENNTSFL